MKNWIIATFLTMPSAPLLAQEIGASCPDLAITGIHSKPKLSEFLDALKAAAATKDANVLSKSVIYPLAFNAKTKKKIKNEEELKAGFNSIFTEKVLGAIKAQKLEEIFCRDQGAMIGDGEVWISEQNGKIGIKTINL